MDGVNLADVFNWCELTGSLRKDSLEQRNSFQFNEISNRSLEDLPKERKLWMQNLSLFY